MVLCETNFESHFESQCFSRTIFFSKFWLVYCWFNLSKLKLQIKTFNSVFTYTNLYHFFEIKFRPRCWVENSTLTLKFWAFRSKGVKRSFGTRISLVMIMGFVIQIWPWVLWVWSSLLMILSRVSGLLNL